MHRTRPEKAARARPWEEGECSFPGGWAAPAVGDGTRTLSVRTKWTSEDRGPESEVPENQAGREASGQKLLSRSSSRRTPARGV